MDDKLKAIKDKIAKLLAKAEGTDNAYEASVFMGKVNELLEQHQIEMHEIRSHGGDNDPMGEQMGEFNLYASMTWSKMLISLCCKYYGARSVWWKQKNHLKYQLFGRESARVTAELMIPFIISQVRQRARQFSEETGRTLSVAQREIGHALTIRVNSMLNASEIHRAELTRNALIPVDTTQDYMDKYYGDTLRVGKARQLKYSNSARDHADRISLNHQATAAGRLQIGSK